MTSATFNSRIIFFHDKAGTKDTSQQSAKVNWHADLGFDHKARLQKRDTHGFLIDSFKKPKSKFIVDLIEDADDLLCQVV